MHTVQKNRQHAANEPNQHRPPVPGVCECGWKARPDGLAGSREDPSGSWIGSGSSLVKADAGLWTHRLDFRRAKNPDPGSLTVIRLVTALVNIYRFRPIALAGRRGLALTTAARRRPGCAARLTALLAGTAHRLLRERLRSSSLDPLRRQACHVARSGCGPLPPSAEPRSDPGMLDGCHTWAQLPCLAALPELDRCGEGRVPDACQGRLAPLVRRGKVAPQSQAPRSPTRSCCARSRRASIGCRSSSP